MDGLWLRRLVLPIALFLSAGSFGCYRESPKLNVFPNALPRIPHVPAKERVVGEACGSHSFLIFRLTSSPSFAEAVQQALARSGTEYNALTDVTADFENADYILWGYTCIHVHGRPVYLGAPAAPEWLTPAGELPAGTTPEQWEF